MVAGSPTESVRIGSWIDHVLIFRGASDVHVIGVESPDPFDSKIDESLMIDLDGNLSELALNIITKHSIDLFN